LAECAARLRTMHCIGCIHRIEYCVELRASDPKIPNKCSAFAFACQYHHSFARSTSLCCRKATTLPGWRRLSLETIQRRTLVARCSKPATIPQRCTILSFTPTWSWQVRGLIGLSIERLRQLQFFCVARPSCTLVSAQVPMLQPEDPMNTT
jgi:hypothetical protein